MLSLPSLFLFSPEYRGLSRTRRLMSLSNRRNGDIQESYLLTNNLYIGLLNARSINFSCIKPFLCSCCYYGRYPHKYQMQLGGFYVKLGLASVFCYSLVGMGKDKATKQMNQAYSPDLVAPQRAKIKRADQFLYKPDLGIRRVIFLAKDVRGRNRWMDSGQQDHF